MPVTTFMHPSSYLEPVGTSDGALEIDDLLDKVRAKTGKDWRVSLSQIPSWHWWQKKPAELYTVYCGLGSSPMGHEFQVINFLSGTEVSAEVVQAFFYGMLAGVRSL